MSLVGMKYAEFAILPSPKGILSAGRGFIDGLFIRALIIVSVRTVVNFAGHPRRLFQGRERLSNTSDGGK